jgi:hypothetical protein
VAWLLEYYSRFHLLCLFYNPLCRYSRCLSISCDLFVSLPLCLLRIEKERGRERERRIEEGRGTAISCLACVIISVDSAPLGTMVGVKYVLGSYHR